MLSVTLNKQCFIAGLHAYRDISACYASKLRRFLRQGVCRSSFLMEKVVCDVGAGTGILSFFAAQVRAVWCIWVVTSQAGAKRVYAIEASGMAEHAKVFCFLKKILITRHSFDTISWKESLLCCTASVRRFVAALDSCDARSWSCRSRWTLLFQNLWELCLSTNACWRAMSMLVNG